MKKLLNGLTGVDGLSPDVAWALIDGLYHDILTVVTGCIVAISFGFVGFIHTGSVYYLVSVGYTVLLLMWRLWLQTKFLQADRTVSPVGWSLHRLFSALAFGAGWGATTLVIPYEPDPYFIALTIGMHAGLTTGGLLRNGTIPPIAVGQHLVASVPMFLFCALSDQFALQFYSGLVLLNFIFGLRLSKTLRRQAIGLLVRDREKSEIADRLAIANQELAEVNTRLETMASTDALTDVPNRRAFDLALVREMRRSKREWTPLSLLLLDIDHFKKYNDFYGHQAGDACLRQIAATVAGAVGRPGDMVARYGGEEFAVILPGTPIEGAAHIASIIIAAAARQALPHQASDYGFVTLSIGVACAEPQCEEVPAALIGRADAALYEAKASGRNRAHVAEPVSLGTTGARSEY